ncbi:MAG: TolC family protein [Armatimonadota bacterium]
MRTQIDLLVVAMMDVGTNVVRSATWFVATVALVGLSWSATAQEAPQSLTLQEALALALERSPAVAAAESDLRGREAALDSQKGRWLPRLTSDWNWRWQQSLPRSVNIGGGTIVTQRQRTTTRDLSVTLSQVFWQSGLPEAIASSRQQVRASEAGLENQQRQLLVRVAATFLTILGNRELAQVAEEAVTASERHLELVEARIEAGAAAPADRFPVEAELADARLQSVTAENAVWQAIAELRSLLALPPDALPLLRGELEEREARGDLQAWIDEALAQRADLRAQRYNVRGAELSVSQAEIDAGLSLSLQGSADYGRYSGTSGESWWLGAGASFPLHDRQARAAVDQAEASLESSRQRLAELELSVAQEVSQAFYALEDASQRVAAAEASVAAAATNLEAAQARYAEGAAYIIEVTDAELSWRRASTSLVQARFDRTLAYYQLLAAAGRLLTEPGAGEPAALPADNETVEAP